MVVITRRYGSCPKIPQKGHNCAAALVCSGFASFGAEVQNAAGVEKIKECWGRVEAGFLAEEK